MILPSNPKASKPSSKDTSAKKTGQLTHTQRLKHQGKMLEQIMAWKREELPGRQRLVPIAELRALAATTPEPMDFAAALRQPGVSLIAEVKRASPSRGLLCQDFDPVKLAQTYAQGGATAISVLTDSRYFQGHLEYLTAVKEALAFGGKGREQEEKRDMRSTPPTASPRLAPSPVCPLLRKDFIFDPYQVVEARVAGADALLLIVAVLGDGALRNLLQETKHYGMTALVEVHNEQEVERALTAGAQVIGINNRDLRTFAVDLQTTARLRALVPADRVIVSESGIHTPDDVRRLRDLRVDAVLVGESLVTAAPGERLTTARRLVQAGLE